ncbi:MAG TPA: CsbD family protein [Candidatus Limnocylindria bacterium]|nr:CsbD family protein [Candidatus Limnocylindria bacterium]
MDDQVKGEMQKAEGMVKEEFGKVVGDRSTEWGGKVDQLKGDVQKKAGEIEQEGPARRERRRARVAVVRPDLPG